ncbi:hypothetical protein Dm11a5_1369 [Dehalococcoides mccartyi]|uniref:Uncharacterized protein n=1 Tax=Dehalococcoides mccartyi TaxID=61435 RepID=A0A142VDB5_9CHLR|nr:hypothetical protein Dm11a5_1369 [Dehalococcoides mccartyi]
MPVEQDIARLSAPCNWDKMMEVYSTLGLYPNGHIMASLRQKLGKGICTNRGIENLKDGDYLLLPDWLSAASASAER